ncbi:hypothetical protein ACQPXS_35835 [Streptomyces sp. CA-142005]|uniref:hypothetical protein n=1 Tax=Streptomyces sp. CA-142005 TaxID=3240052 RepID=UPI003D91D06A
MDIGAVRGGRGAGLRERWVGLPLWARWVLAAYVVGLLEGTCAHLLDLTRGGIHAYASYPLVSQVLFIGMVFLDPLAAVLVGLLRKEGIWLAGAVMVFDVCANWFGNWSWVRNHPVRLVHPVGLLPITAFGLFVVVFLIPMLRTVAASMQPRTDGLV